MTSVTSLNDVESDRQWTVDALRDGRDYITAIDLLAASPAASGTDPFSARFLTMTATPGRWQQVSPKADVSSAVAELSIHTPGAPSRWAFRPDMPARPVRASPDYPIYIDAKAVQHEGDRILTPVAVGAVLLEQIMELIRSAAFEVTHGQKYVISAVVGSATCLTPVAADNTDELTLQFIEAQFKTVRFALGKRHRGYILFSERPVDGLGPAP